MSLGTCTRATDQKQGKCQGNLEVSGHMVRCGRCGKQYPEHPLIKGWSEPQPAPPAPVVQSSEVSWSMMDRLLMLERASKAHWEQIQELLRIQAEIRESLQLQPTGTVEGVQARRRPRGE